MKTRHPSVVSVAVAILCLVIGGAAGYHLPTPEIQIDWGLEVEGQDEYRPSFSLQGGEEIAFIFIGASSCPAASKGDVISTVRTAKKAVGNRLDSLELSYTTIGVAKDWSTQEGINYLERLGKFNQITVGGNWMNMAIMKYVHDGISGQAATPQLLLVHRKVRGIEAPTFSIEKETLLLRKVGVNEIMRWASSGYPIPEV